MASFSEGLLLAEKVGLDPNVLVEVNYHLSFFALFFQASFLCMISVNFFYDFDKHLTFQVVSQGAISSPMYSLKGPAMVKAAYPTAFPLKHQQKVKILLFYF